MQFRAALWMQATPIWLRPLPPISAAYFLAVTGWGNTSCGGRRVEKTNRVCPCQHSVWALGKYKPPAFPLILLLKNIWIWSREWNMCIFTLYLGSGECVQSVGTKGSLWRLASCGRWIIRHRASPVFYPHYAHYPPYWTGRAGRERKREREDSALVGFVGLHTVQMWEWLILVPTSLLWSSPPRQSPNVPRDLEKHLFN